ncbi:hypothetical protein Ancab_032389 [Ancistrocladus abbreviatus]
MELPRRQTFHASCSSQNGEENGRRNGRLLLLHVSSHFWLWSTAVLHQAVDRFGSALLFRLSCMYQKPLHAVGRRDTDFKLSKPLYIVIYLEDFSSAVFITVLSN